MGVKEPHCSLLSAVGGWGMNSVPLLSPLPATAYKVLVNPQPEKKKISHLSVGCDSSRSRAEAPGATAQVSHRSSCSAAGGHRYPNLQPSAKRKESSGENVAGPSIASRGAASCGITCSAAWLGSSQQQSQGLGEDCYSPERLADARSRVLRCRSSRS